jgi:hypothetical protein
VSPNGKRDTALEQEPSHLIDDRGATGDETGAEPVDRWQIQLLIVLSGTNRMVGRWTASPIASASSRSFFCDLTNGFTYWGGIRRTSCPCAIRIQPR